MNWQKHYKVQQKQLWSCASGVEQSHVAVPWAEGGFAGKDFGIVVHSKVNVNQQRALAAKMNCTLSFFLAGVWPAGWVKRFFPLAWHLCKHVSQYGVLFWTSQYKTDVDTLEHVQWIMGGWSTQCMRRGWELGFFGLYQIRMGEDTVAVFSNLTGGCREEGVRLFWQVHSDRMRSNREVATQEIFIRCVGRYFTTWTDCLDKLGNLHPWRLSKLCWVRPSAAWSSWTRFEWEVGLDDLQRSLQPT